MPKAAPYRLGWDPKQGTYILHDTGSQWALSVAPDSHAWLDGLASIPSFTFRGQHGQLTLRQETRSGRTYWYAYRRVGQKMTKRYLGRTTELTPARLEQVAAQLAADALSLRQGPLTPGGARAEPASEHALTSPIASLHSGMSARSAMSPLPECLHDVRVATKLHQPRLRTQLVRRTHLIQQLQQGMEASLTLISAPAGFGKTTLLAQWQASTRIPVAWLSLEPEDNDPPRFLAYLIAALQTLDAQMGTTALELLGQQPAPPEAVLAVLINDLMSRDAEDFALVLDDYHLITADPIQRGMTYLVVHLPPQMHLLLATRTDPPFPLSRLRAHGQLCEVRTADLRFGAAEVKTFLQITMGLELEASAIATLERYTEGWIAGLQLAGLSLQGRADPQQFLAAFSGSHRYVLDYLSDEVLARQDASVQQFLLHTCLLERLSGPLCDAVTEQEGSQAMLEALEKANLFVVALDEERSWYRYHHLFAEVLRRHLQQAEPTLVPFLHRRASAWYEQHGLSAEGVRHALAVPDFELAACLIEPIALSMAFQGQLSTVIEWLRALPQALVCSRPFLCVVYAKLLIHINQLETAEELLQQTERYVPSAELPAERARVIQGGILTMRTASASFSGDLPHMISLARQALDLQPDAEGRFRPVALAFAIRTYQVSGEVTLATEQEFAAAVALIRTAGNLLATVMSIALLARLYVLQGRLRQAATTYAQVVQEVPRPEVLHVMFSCYFYYFGLGDLLREWNDLEAAARHLEQGMALVNEALPLDPWAAFLGYTALARLQQARGNTTAALTTLDALLRLAERRHFAAQLMSQAAAVRAQLELVQGNLAAALHWAETSGLSTNDDDLSYLQEGAYLALARVRIAQGREEGAAPFLQEALGLLDRLLKEAETKARLGSVLEILVLRALALEAQGNRTSALSTLERALLLAAPESYIRLLVDEGAPMLALLRQAHARSSVPGYVATLLRAFGEQNISDVPLSSTRPSQLAEPLTEREREVLRLLLMGASNREIARGLVLSVNTVKRHVYNLCGKLGVQSRMQAIIRARALNLL